MTRKHVPRLTSLMAPPLAIALSSSTKPVTGATSNSVAAGVAGATVSRTGGVAQVAAVAVAVEIATGTGTTKYYHTPGEQRAKFAARPACCCLDLILNQHTRPLGRPQGSPN